MTTPASGDAAAPEAATVTTPEGQAPEGQQGQAPTTDQTTEPETFDRAYVENLRREAAQYRTRATAAEQAVQTHQQAGMSEIEREKARADAAESRVTALEADTRRNALQAAVTTEAAALNFHSPALALRLLDESDVIDANGQPTNVRAALAKVLKDNPYLAKRSAADAGDGRQPAGAAGGMNGLIRAAAGRTL